MKTKLFKVTYSDDMFTLYASDVRKGLEYQIKFSGAFDTSVRYKPISVKEVTPAEEEEALATSPVMRRKFVVEITADEVHVNDHNVLMCLSSLDYIRGEGAIAVCEIDPESLITEPTPLDSTNGVIADQSREIEELKEELRTQRLNVKACCSGIRFLKKNNQRLCEGLEAIQEDACSFLSF